MRPLLDVPIRPEFSIEQAPSPQRLAPQAFTLTADAVTDGSSASVGAHVESASGRFVVLHDPDGVDEWEGNDRIVIFARCDVEPELLADPLIHEVAWSWVTEALDNHEVAQLGGTVTVSSGTSFGSMAERPGDGLVEIRASWTPSMMTSPIIWPCGSRFWLPSPAFLLFRRVSQPWVGVGPPTRDAHQGRARGRLESLGRLRNHRCLSPLEPLTLRDGLSPVIDTPDALQAYARAIEQGIRTRRARCRASVGIPLLHAGLSDPGTPRGRRHRPD